MSEFSDLQQEQFGLSAAHLISVEQGGRRFLLHKDAVDAFFTLKKMAAIEGFDLQLVSAYRDFHRQQKIWQAKAQGLRMLLNAQGEVLDFHSLSDKQRMQAMMRWSAVPGLSRHHWGCDMDVFDAAAMSIDQVELVPSEVEGDGPCAALHEWLDEKIDGNLSCGFYRPYHRDSGGIAPERWHLSYLPLASTYMQPFNQAALLALWKQSEIAFYDLLKSDLEAILSNFVDLSVEEQPAWVQSALAG